MMEVLINRDLSAIQHPEGLMDQPTLVASCGINQLLTESPFCVRIHHWNSSYIQSTFRLPVTGTESHDFNFTAEYVEIMTDQPVQITLMTTNSTTVLVPNVYRLFTVWGDGYTGMFVNNNLGNQYGANTKVVAFGP